MGGGLSQKLASRPLVAPSLAFVAGIAAGSQSPRAALLLGLALVVGWWALGRLRQPGGWLFLLGAFAALGASLGGRRAEPGFTPSWLVPAEDTGEVLAVLEGTVVELTTRSAVVAVAQAAPAPDPGSPDHPRLEPASFRVRLGGLADDVDLGCQVRVRARLSHPEPPSNPGQLDWAGRELRAGIAWEGQVAAGELLRLTQAPFLSRHAAAARRRVLTATAAIADTRARGLVEALAVGRRAEIDEDTETWFGNSGLAHLLAVAGLHVGAIALALHALARWLLLRVERAALRWDVSRLAGLITLPSLWAYVVITGSNIPAVRAALLITSAIVSRSLGRSSDTASMLGLAAMAVLTLDPGALWDPAFQLSFAAVGGLALVGNAIAGPLRLRAPHGPQALWKRVARSLGVALIAAASTSVAVTLSAAPVLVGTFHRLSLVSPLANAVALPLGLMLAGLCSIAPLVSASPPLLSAVLWLAAPLAHGLTSVAQAFGSDRYSVLHLPSFSLTTTAAYYGLLITLAPPGRREPLRLALAVLASGVLAIQGILYLATPSLRTDLQVTFLSVGQGDSAVLELPGGEAILIDGGGDPGNERADPGERVVLPFLLEHGVTHLRALVLSHPHPDHALGLISVARRLSTDEVWIADEPDDGALVQRLISEARTRSGDQIPIRRLRAGAELRLGQAVIDALAPTEAPGTFAKVNDQSLVLRLVYGETSFLFPGDIEKSAEGALLSSGAQLGSVVLKAPHHGSITSSTREWVSRVHPRYVVFCVGRHNRFGFPSQEVEGRYADIGAVRLRTDRDGAIAFQSDGLRVSAATYLGDEREEVQLEADEPP